jgi:O-antigen/teichoic acid export membrane protein
MPVAEISKNVLANVLGKGWTAIVSLALIPVYVGIMGVEAYGLVGLFVMLQGLLAIFDMGLSTTLNRELARLSVEPGGESGARDLVRTMELAYWGIAALIAIPLLLLSPLIAQYWINAGRLPVDAIGQAIMAMGLAVALQFPFSLYTGGLMGLQKQFLYNCLISGMAVFRGAGAVLVLYLVSPTIQAFFAWQIVSNILQTALGAFLLWRSLPGAGSPRFRPALFSGIWRFTLSVSGINILDIILVQADKVILSKMLPLETFGYYMLASTVASSIPMIVIPVFMAIFPGMSRLIMQGDEAGLKRLYHHGCQLVSILIIPLALVAALFMPEVLWIWTRNAAIVDNVRPIAVILVAGWALNAMVNIPYALQLASGWTRLALYQNLISILFIIPMLILMAVYYGAAGAAVPWALLNIGYFAIGIYVMHMYLLKEELKAWYVSDVGLPLAGALAVAVPARLLLSPALTGATLAGAVLAVGAVFLLTCAASALTTPLARDRIIRGYRSFIRDRLRAGPIIRLNSLLR